MAPGFWGQSQGAPDEGPSIYERLVMEEQRENARRTGRRVGDVLESRQLEAALEATAALPRSASRGSLGAASSAPSLDDGASLRDDDDVAGEDCGGGGAGPVAPAAAADAAEQRSPLALAPEELMIRILAYCGIEGGAAGAAACRSWRRACASEPLAELLCRRHYGAGRAFRPERWGGWRGMLLRRSRLRLGGFYALRQSRSKPVKQDMNTPRELAGTFWLEVAWWRVFRFFGDGTVAYALFNEDRADPKRRAAALLAAPARAAAAPDRRRRAAPKRDAATLGAYELAKRDVSMLLELPYGCMRFAATLRHGDLGAHFATLDLDRHQQIEPDGRVLDHTVPEVAGFKFVAVAAWA